MTVCDVCVTHRANGTIDAAFLAQICTGHENSISIQSKTSVCKRGYTVCALSHFVQNVIMVDQEVMQCDLRRD